jgi:bifunctional ADP-heptose synthase (sugar kinase/adenylyltransferase)
MIRYDLESISDLDSNEELNLVKKIRTLVLEEKPQALIFEDYNKGVLTKKVIEEVIKLCRAHHIITAVDPKKKNFFSYKNADLFKPNLREIHDAFNTDISVINESALKEAAKKLTKRLSNKITLITLSENGIFYSGRQQAGIIPAISVMFLTYQVQAIQ